MSHEGGLRNRTVPGGLFMKKRLEEQILQTFPYRCPYCDQEISYEKMNLKCGENEIECPSCKGRYIKVIPPSSEE